MKKHSKIRLRLPSLFFMAAVLLIFTSCVGITAAIQMRKDGSGRIAIEYRFSRMAETIGRLDGNEKLPVIPVGKTDWERTAARIEGLKIVSFSSREDKQDIVNKVVLDFKDSAALVNFLDPKGKRANFNYSESKKHLSLIINEPVSKVIDSDLLELMRQVSSGYKFKLSFSADRNSTLTLTDGSGNKISPEAEAKIIPSGKKVSIEIDTAEIFRMSDGLGVIFDW